MKGGFSCGVHTLPLELGIIGHGSNATAEIPFLEVRRLIPTHVRRFCKDVLRQYPFMKKELATLEEECKAVAGAIPSAWPAEVRIKAIGDRTANQAFRLLRLEERWRQVKFYVEAVEDLLAYLDEERRKLVELHFFKGLPPWRVAQELNICERNFYRNEKEILVLLAHRLGL
ncbi:MAG: ECF-type sigma factor [Thermovenabulum sp.]|uniref:ECF-type sigma factor n=1 Tax=Thermovenabulum sp. TaxID=3100335 RepID=UPI003C7CC5EA